MGGTDSQPDAGMVDTMSSDGSGGNISQKDAGCFLSAEEIIQEISEEGKPILCAAGDSCNFSEAPPSTSTNCSPVAEFISQQPPHFVCKRENHSLNHYQYSVPDAAIGKVAAPDATDCGLIFSGSRTDPCDPADIGGNIESKFDCVVTRRRNPKRAASLKSMFNIGKLDPQAGKKHVRASTKVICGLSNFIQDSLSKATKKRSVRKLTHSSDWGAIENLYTMFKQDDDGFVQNARAISSRRSSRKSASSSRGKRRESKTKKAAKSSRTEAVNTANLLCLEDRSTHLPDLIDAPLFKKGVPENCLTDRKDHGDAICHNFAVLQNSITSLEGDIQHLDKDLDSSVTEEVSGENNSRDFPGVSSQAFPQSLQDSSEDGLPIYPGTSPESDVIHPTADAGITASDAVTSLDREPSVGVGFIIQSANVLESSMHDKLISDACTLPFGSRPVSSLILQQSTINIEDKSSTFHLSKNCSIGQMLNGLASLDEAGEVSICSKHKLKAEDESNFLKCYNRKTNKKPIKSVSDQELQAGKPSGETVNNLLYCPETFRAKIGEQSCLSSCAGGKIIKDAKGGESKCETPTSSENSKRQNSDRRNKKDRGLANKHKDKRKPLLDKLNVGRGMHAFNVCTEKNEELPLTGGLGMPNACSPNAIVESASHLGMQNGCLSNAVVEPAKTSMGEDILLDLVGSNARNVLESEVAYNHDKVEIQNFDCQGLETLSSQEQVAWVCCDDCSKWRCIPEKLADVIGETKCRWTCKDNDNKMFADCSIPQEKSNAEINAELGILDEEVIYDVQQSSHIPVSVNLTAHKRATWIGIRSNMFLHRSRKKQTIDEIMVCHCKPPLDGSMGCKDECLNRMLNIECVRGTCPCGDLCSNQQFQKRKYSKMKWFHSGKKGYGLKLCENVCEGDFLIEYVGEVLDMTTYEGRQSEYASRGQEHFYFMTLNSHEVIDACSKGNLGRFINHSCEPNCRTEKWMVKGEVCIGLFAMRDIKKGEEITFDYNYVRVVGAAAKKCFCGSIYCRGFIGGDPLNSENIVHCDSDEEYPRSMMIREDDSAELGLKQRVSNANEIADVLQDDGNRALNLEKEGRESILVSAQQHEDVSVCVKDTVDASLCNNTEPENLLPTEETMCRSLPDVQPSEISSGANSLSKSLVETALDDKIKLPADTSEHRMDTLKPCAPSKLPHLSGNNKSSAGVKTFIFQKSRKIIGDGFSRQFEGVEEKLNPLLDSDGGISKRKDSTKGYLKLLVVTAASNNAENEAIQSTRDLSLILDALLKTKSRTVLTDIINKNGLQMLHTIMKQNRKNCIKIPILRKLLKVLEFLASKGILTVEHINMDPAYMGVESFRDSIISLMYHSDIQVHQIARSFRDRWIPRSYRRTGQVHRDRCWLDPHNENSGSLFPCKRQIDSAVKNTDANNSVAQKICISSASTNRHSNPDMSVTNQKVSDHVEEVGHVSLNVTRIRKRKSRWDQDKPPDKTRSKSMASVALEETNFQSLRTNSQQMKFDQVGEADLSANGAAASNSFQKDIDDDVPPGFDSPLGFVPPYWSEDPEVAVDMPAASGCVVGQIQERYLAQLTISHGIPLALMQQLGTPGDANGSNQCFQWTVAPGMPFHPFPPLPPYPREKLNARPPPSTGSSSSVNHRLMASGATDSSHLNGRFISSCQCDPSVPCISGETSSLISETELIDEHYFERCQRPVSGRCSFRPERCNNRGCRRFGPPWARDMINHQFKGNLRCGAHGRILENARKKDGGAGDPNGVRGEHVGSAFHQQPEDSLIIGHAETQV